MWGSPLQKTIRMLLSTIHEVVDHHTETSYVTNEPLLLAVGNRQTASPGLDVAHEEWEDLCRECGGWEWIDGELDGIAGGQGKNKEKRNEFGGKFWPFFPLDEGPPYSRYFVWADCRNHGIEKVGIERLKEALEANEWDGVELDALSDDLGLDDGFGAEAAQVEREMMGLKMAVQGDESDEGGDESVDELETMMLKMQAIKDMGADMPDAERRKFAAKAVAGVTKNL